MEQSRMWLPQGGAIDSDKGISLLSLEKAGQ